MEKKLSSYLFEYIYWRRSSSEFRVNKGWLLIIALPNFAYAGHGPDREFLVAFTAVAAFGLASVLGLFTGLLKTNYSISMAFSVGLPAGIFLLTMLYERQPDLEIGLMIIAALSVGFVVGRSIVTFFKTILAWLKSKDEPKRTD